MGPKRLIIRQSRRCHGITAGAMACSPPRVLIFVELRFRDLAQGRGLAMEHHEDDRNVNRDPSELFWQFRKCHGITAGVDAHSPPRISILGFPLPRLKHGRAGLIRTWSQRLWARSWLIFRSSGVPRNNGGGGVKRPTSNHVGFRSGRKDRVGCIAEPWRLQFACET